ncbi:hypothetical protein BDZ91DRAFT_837736 [Kalaharituber pfeilii]|nr:hypothetical protein BDZ91DRAFT_837736 [Kalaharituber pfeilii]
MPRPYTRYPCGIYGPRNLVRRHARRVKNRLLAQKGLAVADEPPILQPGQEQLFSYYAPALDAGVYTVTATQDINSPQTTETYSLPEAGAPKSVQKFEVVAPRFNLPDDAIHSSYPPQGYGALANTLPHVVLTDPHLPWDRFASKYPSDHDPEFNRNRVPWLALLVFTADELKLSADELNGSDGLFTNTSLAGNVKQTQTFAINMQVEDVSKIKSTISPINGLKPEPSDDKTTNVVLVPSKLFAELVTSYDGDGNPVSGQKGPDVSRYKYLAHTRDINTTGMADAGVEDNGVFGIVISHRTGPLSNTQPQPVVVHLVSIEGVEPMNDNWPINFDTTKYVAMSSLYSWNFVTLPEGSFNVEEALANLGTTLNVLRAPDAVIKGIDTTTAFGKRLQGRLQDGYTLTKYRTTTGEITAAISRGPLTPTKVPYPLLPAQKEKTGTTWLSNSGIDLQIMDPEVGLMDITYSVAWQLGKTLAVADKSFATSLIKLRASILEPAMNLAKAEVLRARNAYKPRGETLASLARSIPALKRLHKATPGLHAPGGGMEDRWRRPQAQHLDLGFYSPHIQEVFQKHATEIGRQLMLSSDGDCSERYDEQNTPNSIDWMIVLDWVLNKMFLYNIPAHYLIADPTYLAPETLRFFHIDRNWIDALIDGALSLGNHLDGVDEVRKTIHGMIDAYVNPGPQVQPKPQIPTYGFLLHSETVTKYPDLKVEVVINGAHEHNPILRHDNLDVTKGVMLCLFDQLPGNPGLTSITFTQPPHQQSFIAGAELDSHHVKTLYKRIYTVPGQEPNPRPWTEYEWMRPSDSDPAPTVSSDVPHAKAVFKWGEEATPEVRTLLFPAWAQDVNGVLNHFGALNPDQSGNPIYKDDYPNAAMAGIQMNNPIYRLVIQYGASAPHLFSEPERGRTLTVPFPPTVESAPASLQTLAAVSGPTEEPHSSEEQTAPEQVLSTVSPYTGSDAPQISVVNAGFELGSPQYKISCYPVDNDPLKPGIPTVGSATKVPRDLVFSVVQDPDSVGPGSEDNYNLHSMSILLELAFGPKDSDDSRWKTCLLSEYTGPGPFMLSNLRFNVLAQIFDDTVHKRCLELRIIPRTTRRENSVPPNQCKEMSFILPVCNILEHDPKRRIPVWITPQYLNFDAITTEKYHVLLLQAQP